ncbi:hypothetical protein [Oryza sativa Japonica Group]|uniref:Uncharacterized protein P0460H02.16 n=1 Tax=Oryza sativa subsp. japonica TaxID=39947 RepID=Q94DQ9_ORYSJ|nr:hypothetical protein [Oryza sativa Japonica Group]
MEHIVRALITLANRSAITISPGKTNRLVPIHVLLEMRASKHSSLAGTGVLAPGDGTLVPVRYMPGFIPTITSKILYEEGRTCRLLDGHVVDKNDRFVTGLTLIMSSADNHVPTLHLLLAEWRSTRTQE